ncbi:hypothetical protein Nepgr_001661 [Nepenthes gracilis]|uniref:Uncharacterized protein n=1 Tax=Nepenthes gracilis TaxID=150966 RepID=A0AAD3RW79_NEPGR|nr:hypothetical protein Nepgr_001661 [Nepenthes gracilis]
MERSPSRPCKLVVVGCRRRGVRREGWKKRKCKNIFDTPAIYATLLKLSGSHNRVSSCEFDRYAFFNLLFRRRSLLMT